MSDELELKCPECREVIVRMTPYQIGNGRWTALMYCKKCDKKIPVYEMVEIKVK